MREECEDTPKIDAEPRRPCGRRGFFQLLDEPYGVVMLTTTLVMAVRPKLSLTLRSTT